MEAFLITAGLLVTIFGISAFGLKKINRKFDKSENNHRFDLIGKSIVYIITFVFFSLLIVYGVNYYNDHNIGENPASFANDLIDIKLNYSIESIRSNSVKIIVNAILIDKKSTLTNESYVIKFVWKNSSNIKKSKNISVSDYSLTTSTILDLEKDDYQLYAVLYWKSNTIPSTAIDLKFKGL